MLAFAVFLLTVISVCKLTSTVMEKHEVVPDVIDAVPNETCDVKFPSGVTATFGNELTPTKVKDQPTVTWNADSTAYYTVCMVDPDPPSRKNPKFREWSHWLVGNVPGNDISKGDVLSAYIGSLPPKDSGLHRYVILVYKQPKKLTFDEKRLPNNSGANRGGFHIKKFAEKYELGQPLAGNFFQAQWDPHVSAKYKEFKS